MKEYKEEESFEALGEKFRCVEDIHQKRCTKCALSSSKYDDECENFACTRSDRKDGKLTIAVKENTL